MYTNAKRGDELVKLFSIKQKYSDRIFSKKKLVEFRRRNVNVDSNETCLVYTSSPIKKITGYFVVKQKFRLPVERLWNKTKEIAGITRNEFLRYFEGCKEGTAIIFKFVKKFVDGLELRKIKSKLKEFRPPQSYYNLNHDLLIMLNKLFLANGIKDPTISAI